LFSSKKCSTKKLHANVKRNSQKGEAMNAEQAWQSVLGQLQMEMPRASFDTWVRDTKPVSYQDGTLTIGVRNAYARDWLESRLASTVNRLLVGILNASVSVNFVVNDVEEISSIDVFSDASEEPEDSKPEDEQELTALDYDSVYEQIVKPRRGAYVLGYFRRWLRRLGPDLAWMYIGFFQTVYMAGSRTGKATNRIPGKKIAALAGCTERTYWRRIEKPETWKKLKGLVNISDHGPEWDSNSSTPKRLPRRYTVAMTLPLNPVDAASLNRWLTAHMAQCGGVEGVLRAAVEVPLTELIPLDAREVTEPITVRKLVRDLFGGGELSDELLDSLASAIQNHIMPQNDRIFIAQFFLEHILLHLGAGPGWMLTLLRDMCYTNRETGESRNRVTVKGGYAEIASWLGMTRPKTIWEWLNAKFPPSHAEAGKYNNAVLRLYISEINKDEQLLDFAGQLRAFDVLLEEIPAELFEIALTDPNGAIVSIAMARLSESVGANVSIGVARMSESIGAFDSIGVARFTESVGAIVRVFKSLNSLKPNLLNSVNTTTLNTSRAESPAKWDGATRAPALRARRSAGEGAHEKQVDPTVEKGVELPSAWVLDRLLVQNKVHPKTQKTVRGGSVKALVSWLLYALSSEGSGISKPLNYALARLAEDTQSGAGDQYDQLASLPPAVLIGLADRASRGLISVSLFTGEEDELAAMWVNTMGTEKRPALTLMRLLLGNQAPHSQKFITETDRWLDDATHLIERRIEES
jgi:hypothetical protein